MEYKWHKFPQEMPENEGPYLTYNNKGSVTVRQFKKEFVKSDGIVAFRNTFTRGARDSCSVYCASKDVVFWGELPAPPKPDGGLLEIDRLTQEIYRLKEKLKHLKAEQEASYGKQN